MPFFGNQESLQVRIESSSDSRGIDKASTSIDRLGRASAGNVGNLKKLQNSFLPLAAISASAGVAFDRLTGFMGGTIKSANNLQSALIGLNTVAKAFGKDAGEAEKAARDLASDGLMTVTDAANGLKNLLASGFELPEAIKLMERFKDSAAFNRQGTLEFGSAIVSATQGIKNGNSILVDNAGVTKNLSLILEEAGFSAQDLMKATTDSTIRMALFNGILKETAPQLGDAARLADTAAGKQAQMSAQSEILKARIGESLQPALLGLLETLTPMVKSFAQFAEDHPQVVSSFLIIGTAVVGLTALLGGLGLALTGLPALFTAMQVASTGSLAIVRASFMGLSTLVATPLVIPALATAAALASIGKVLAEWNKLRGIRDEIERSENSVSDSRRDFGLSLKRRFERGEISSEERARLWRESAPDALAEGGHMQAGRPYLVGEEGPELVMPNRSGTVIPAGETASMMGSDNSSHTTINQTNNIYNQIDMDAANRELGYRLATA